MSATALKLKPAAAPPTATSRMSDFRILVVDDEEEVHAVTRLILEKVRFNGRGIKILSAYSAAEAHALLEREQDIAAILLDVVMETEDAGLRLVQAIREEMGRRAVRIILRTGQPGQAPEERVIVDYDINDYKAKSELTAQKLFTTVVAALRSYETIVSLEKTRQGLEKILASTGTLFQVTSLQQFASGVLTQLSAFLGCRPNGIICAQFDQDTMHEKTAPCGELSILAATGEYDVCMNCPKDGTCCPHPEMLQLVRQALNQRRNQFQDPYTVIYLDSGDNHQGTAALVHGAVGMSDESGRKLLEVFSAQISIAMSNALTYMKMVSAEQAATTDFLTSLDNRRQLLRLGVPLAAGAYRAGTPLAVAMLDIDLFKQVNDTWGHDAGDEVLRRVGHLLKERFRASDVVARFGGEEFCVIATGLGAEAAFELFDGFRRQLAMQVFEFGGKKVSLTISIGVTSQVASSIDAMISAADALLYRAKQEGRNRVVLD